MKENDSENGAHARENGMAYIAIALALILGGLLVYAYMKYLSPQASGPVTVVSEESSVKEVTELQPRESSVSWADDGNEVSSSDTPTSTNASPRTVAETSAESAAVPQSKEPTGERLMSTSEFWGIWTLASKEYEECAEYVRDVRSKGFDAYVTETTLWENLNDEPWYVVTIGVYSSQDEANAALPRVQNELDDTAYTKYSGLYVG